MKKSSYILISLIAFIFIYASCEEETRGFLTEGTYRIKKIDSDLGDNASIDRKQNLIDKDNGFIQVTGKDSIYFPLLINFEPETTGNMFRYSLNNKEITFKQKEFEVTYPVSFDKDSILKIDLDAPQVSSIYLEYQKLKLSGFYNIASYERNKDMNQDSASLYYDKLFNGSVLEFRENNQVFIDPQFAGYITGDTLNTSYNYNVTGDVIRFSNDAGSFDIPYSYDGILHLYPNDHNYSRLDLNQNSKDK